MESGATEPNTLGSNGSNGIPLAASVTSPGSNELLLAVWFTCLLVVFKWIQISPGIRDRSRIQFVGGATMMPLCSSHISGKL